MPQPPHHPPANPAEPVYIQFDNNALLPNLFGQHGEHLRHIEKALGVQLSTRGNRVAVVGANSSCELARQVLITLYERTKRGVLLDDGEIDSAIRASAALPGAELFTEGGGIKTRKRYVEPRTAGQKTYVDALQKHDMTFGVGPAGTGKTYLAVAMGVAMLAANQVDRIILSRPAVEAGERLGFLPGDLKDKVDPYLRPLYDALYDMMPSDQVVRRMESGEIEIAPLAFMRGRTLHHAYVILDEAQNTTPAQMKMFLTRLGERSKMVITGDLTQIDLPAGQRSGLAEAIDVLAGVEGVAVTRFTDQDVVRHPLVGRIIRAYEAKT
jgi:phosphate starvation-inducible PhoH-like protein